MKGHREIIETIIKECYWDYTITIEEVEKIVQSDSLRMKSKLFHKIIYNSTDRLQSLSLFKNEDLTDLFNSFSSLYQNKRVEKSVLALRNLLLGEKNNIPGQEWKKI
jgi:hypothetical protein